MRNTNLYTKNIWNLNMVSYIIVSFCILFNAFFSLNVSLLCIYNKALIVKDTISKKIIGHHTCQIRHIEIQDILFKFTL